MKWLYQCFTSFHLHEYYFEIGFRVHGFQLDSCFFCSVFFLFCKICLFIWNMLKCQTMLDQRRLYWRFLFKNDDNNFMVVCIFVWKIQMQSPFRLKTNFDLYVFNVIRLNFHPIFSFFFFFECVLCDVNAPNCVDLLVLKCIRIIWFGQFSLLLIITQFLFQFWYQNSKWKLPEPLLYLLFIEFICDFIRKNKEERYPKIFWFRFKKKKKLSMLSVLTQNYF